MKTIRGVELKKGSHEELLPNFSPKFPYIASYIELDQFIGRQSPWHWHKEVELFYMEQGTLEYETPQGKHIFSSGSGGLVNSNVLHMTKAKEGVKTVTTLLHLFDPILISGQQGSLIEQKYVAPLTASQQTEIIGLYPENPEHAKLLELLRQSFELSEDSFAYEIRLRTALSELWCRFFELATPLHEEGSNKISDKIKTMMVFVHEHYADKITVAEIAAAAFISERECFRIFRDCLHTTPVEYARSYRMQRACRMLVEGRESITDIGQACGLGSSSYFGKTFREQTGHSPMEYRSESRKGGIVI